MSRLRFAPFLLLCCWLLSGCGGRSHTQKTAFLRLRAQWLEKGSVTLRGEMRADYGDRVYDYLLRYEGGGEGGTLTVEKPLELEGVEAVIGEKGVTLRYDGAVLDTGAILGKLSPLEAFPLLVHCWQSGCLTDCWKETWNGEGCLTAEFDLTEAGSSETRLCRTRFRASDGVPLTAELISDGAVVLSCRFTLPVEE